MRDLSTITQTRSLMLGHASRACRLLALTCIAPVHQVFRGAQAAKPSFRLLATAETSKEGQELAEWIRTGGGTCELVNIASDSEHGQTLVASQAIRKGQLLITLPRRCQLTAESSDPALQGLIDQVPQDLWAARLALPVVAERAKGSESRFLPYMHSLPAGVGGLPMFFRPEEIRELQYPPLIQQINLRCRWLLKFAAEQLASAAAEGIFNGVKVDVNLLGWGMGIASSRAFKVGASRQPSMLPCIDLCNHSFAPNCALESQGDNSVSLIAREDIPADEPLTITYGALSNTTLLQDYGFIMQDNPHDSVVMRLSVDYIQVAQALAGVGASQEPKAWQAQVLAKVDALGSGTAVPLTRGGSMFDWRLVAAVRALCASERQELEGRDPLQLGDLSWQLADSVEQKALRTLAAMCAQLIAAMGTKLGDDRKLLLLPHGLSANSRLAIHFRMELKKFIQAALALVLQELKRLQTARQ